MELSLRDAPRTLSVYEDRYHDTRSLRRLEIALPRAHANAHAPRDAPPARLAAVACSHPVSRILAMPAAMGRMRDSSDSSSPAALRRAPGGCSALEID